MKSIMMIASATFFAILTSSLSAYAIYNPGSDSIPIYSCDSESLQVQILKKNNGHTMILMETHSDQGQVTTLLETQVSELRNKTHTIYTSDEVILKMTHDNSGFMPSRLIVTQKMNQTQSEMQCQLMYNVMDPPASVI